MVDHKAPRMHGPPCEFDKAIWDFIDLTLHRVYNEELQVDNLGIMINQ